LVPKIKGSAAAEWGSMKEKKGGLKREKGGGQRGGKRVGEKECIRNACRLNGVGNKWSACKRRSGGSGNKRKYHQSNRKGNFPRISKPLDPMRTADNKRREENWGGAQERKRQVRTLQAEAWLGKKWTKGK